MIVLLFDWIQWPAVFVIIGVSATWAEVWLRNRREQRRELDIDARLEMLERREREVRGSFRHVDLRLMKLEGVTPPPGFGDLDGLD